MNVVYDAAVLVAADRGDRSVWVAHEERLGKGIRPQTTAPVVAQASRSGRQALLHRFLKSCQIVAFEADDAHEVGALLAATGQADVVDAHVVLTAARSGAIVRTSDVQDLEPLARATRRPVRVLPH